MGIKGEVEDPLGGGWQFQTDLASLVKIHVYVEGLVDLQGRKVSILG